MREAAGRGELPRFQLVTWPRKSGRPCSRKMTALPSCHHCLSLVLGIKCKCPQGPDPVPTPRALSVTPVLSRLCLHPALRWSLSPPLLPFCLQSPRGRFPNGPLTPGTLAPYHGSLGPPHQNRTSSRLGLHLLSCPSVETSKRAASLNSRFCLELHSHRAHVHSFICSFNKKALGPGKFRVGTGPYLHKSVSNQVCVCGWGP